MGRIIVGLVAVLGCSLAAPPAGAERGSCNPRFEEVCEWIENDLGKFTKVCRCEGIPATGVMIPKFFVTHVIYAVPGIDSSVTYEAGSKFGTTTTLTNSQSSSVQVSYEAGVSFVAEAEYTLSLGHEWGSSTAHETDVVVGQVSSYTHTGRADLVNHDDDQIFFLVTPRILTTITPTGTNGATVHWSLDPNQQLTRFHVSVGQLKHPCLMPDSTRLQLESWGITESDYPELLKADPFANGATTPDESRFKRIRSNFTYRPVAFDVDPHHWHHELAREDAESNTETRSVSYTVAMEMSGGVDFIGEATLIFNGSHTWSHSTSTKTTTGTSTKDSFDLYEARFGYDGPQIVDVYVDRIWKTYLFVVGCGRGNPGPCSTLRPCSAEGAKVCQATGATGCEARPGQRELCRWDGATKDQLSSAPPLTQCGPDYYDPNTVVSCVPRYGLWGNYNTGWPVWDEDGACITQTRNLCSTGNFAKCERHGATSCEKIWVPGGTPFDLCRWKDVGESQCGTVAGPGPGGNQGIWTWAWDDFAVNSPGAVQDGNGSCITQATNLPTQGIAVMAGTYGGNCGAARGNDYWGLTKVCESQDRCDYVVDYTVIGDPVPGCGKDYVAEWLCQGTGGFPFLRRATASPEAGYGKTVTLTCP